jgi:hypothetical protein
MMESPNYFPLLTHDEKIDYESAKLKLSELYTKAFAINHANRIFFDITSGKKEKIVRALFLGELATRRMWEVEGSLHYEVLSAKYFRELEFTKLYGIKPVREYDEKHIVSYNPWTMKWMCDCKFFSVYTDIIDCSHIVEIRLTNILKEYLPYFIYAYRFLLPHRCYKHFMMEFAPNRK